VLEIGCGYGSAIFPILSECASVTADVCDFSASAIAILQQNPQYDPARCNAFVCDIVNDELPLPPHSVDVVLLVFVLSALPPATFAQTLQKIDRVLKPGGAVCLRDYGLYDLAMRRNAKRLAPSLYYRSDGTLAYFFSTQDVEKLFSGYEIVENEYCTVRLVNRKKKVAMDRVWIHSKCKKPE
jgi:methyltransferase-like protein 6